MNDLIYRQDAIEAAKDLLKYHGQNLTEELINYFSTNAMERIPSAQQETSILTVKCELDDEELSRAIEAVKNAELELISARQEQQWIPVSERLPETDGYYLVTIKTFGWNGEQYEDVDIARYERKNGWLKADKCIAWMPLIEPYKGEES